MSVIVKGMEMPESCIDCEIKQYDDYENDCVCPFSGVVCLSIGRQDACPIVELPDKHGRLVEFIDVVTTLDEDSGTEEVCVGDIMRAYYEMRNAPTIVESEDET